MQDTFDRKKAVAPNKDSKKTLPAGRFAEQTEAVNHVPNMAEVQDNGRLQQVTVVGKKPESYSVAPTDIESLRPSSMEMKNG